MPTLELIFYDMDKNRNLPPKKIAVLIDGGFFLKRFNFLYNKDRTMTAEEIADALYGLVMKMAKSNVLYRAFYYDCLPLDKKFHSPLTKRCIDFKKSEEYIFRTALFDKLRTKRKVALRLGTLKDNAQWKIKGRVANDLLTGKKRLEDLTDDDITIDVRQKEVDTKIGVDISSLAFKKHVDTIILIAGDADFVPAAKLARREGIDFILHPMEAHIDDRLFEHIDGLISTKISINKHQYKKD